MTFQSPVNSYCPSSRPNSQTRRRIYLGLSLGAMAFWACDQSDDPTTQVEDAGDPPGFSRQEMLQNLAEHVIGPSFEDFAEGAESFAEQLKSYSDALEKNDGQIDEGQLVGVQESFATLMWKAQVLELMQLGPAGDVDKVVGGESLWSEVYSQSKNPCGVDQQVLEKSYEDADFPEKLLVNFRGLDAIEYALFVPDESHACRSDSVVEGWSELDQEEIRTRRALYAAGVAEHVSTIANDLATSWESSGDFGKWLSNPEADDSPYGSIPKALDDLMRAMMFFDTEVKD